MPSNGYKVPDFPGQSGDVPADQLQGAHAPRHAAHAAPEPYAPAATESYAQVTHAMPGQTAQYQAGQQMPQAAQYQAGQQMPYQQMPNQEPPQNNKKKKWRVLYRVSVVVFVLAILALAGIILQYWLQQKAYEELHQYVNVPDTQQIALEDLTVDWKALSEINPDIVGWIYIPNTIVNYPIVQGDSNDTYLRRAFSQESGGYASAGTIFLDSMNQPDFSDRNNAIYGHHMNDGSMFAVLADWNDEEEFNNNRTVFILTPKGNFRLKTFAVVITTGDDRVVQAEFGTEEAYEEYIADKIDRSVVTPSDGFPKPSEVKESFMLATCEYTRSNGRSILYAEVVETTVTDNPWILPARDGGSTGLSAGSSDLGSIGSVE